MADERMSLVARINAVLTTFKAEEWIYFASTILVLLGVGITDYAPASSWLYWIFMIAALATAAIIVEKLRPRVKGAPFLNLVAVQLIHWGATLIAVLISLSLVNTGRLTYEGSGLIVLLLLSLATFLDGLHVGWRFYLIGLLMAIATIFAAYFERFVWIILLIAAISAVFAVYVEKYLSSDRFGRG